MALVALMIPMVTTVVILLVAVGAIVIIWTGLGGDETSAWTTKQRLAASVAVVFLLGAFLVIDVAYEPPASDFLRSGAIDTSAPVASDWKLLSLESGKEVRLSELKGKAIFLNVWATWCPPCVMEMPSIQRLHQVFRDNPDFALVLVSHDQTPEVVTEFLKENRFSFPVYFPLDMPPPEFESPAIPTSFLLDKEHRIQSKFLGPKDWSSEEMIAIFKKLMQ